MNGFGDDRESGKTILRPQPGGARRASRSDAVDAGVARPPASTPLSASADAPRSLAGGVGVDEFIARGQNAIVSAAGPLLSLGVSLRATVSQADVAGLRRQAVEEVKAFETRARASGAAPDDVTIARYIVCTFVDSAVFLTPWGGQSAWGAQSLLSIFHQEASGGEKFFQIMERLRKDPSRYRDLIELQYLCLALGFEGKYRLEPNGRAVVIGLQDDLYRLLASQRGSAGALSPHWEGTAKPEERVMRLLPWWVVVLAAAAVLIGTLITLRVKLSERAAPVVASLAVRGVDVDYQPAPAPPGPGRLKQALTREEQAGLLTVEEFGARSVVTLGAPELFASGSTAVAPDQHAVVIAVGRAIESVPGRVVVVGHTDDQPLRSFRYADNFELSRERALAVATLMKPELSDASRLEWTGLGSTQPRFEPASVAENRRRNRRVEIIHMGE